MKFLQSKPGRSVDTSCLDTTFVKAATRNHVEVLKLLSRMEECQVSPQEMEAAFIAAATGFVKAATEYVVECEAIDNQVGVLQLLFAKGCVGPELISYIFRKAAACSSLQALEFLHKRGSMSADVVDEAFLNALGVNSVDILEFLYKTGIVSPRSVVRGLMDAADTEDLDVLQYLLRCGFTIRALLKDASKTFYAPSSMIKMLSRAYKSLSRKDSYRGPQYQGELVSLSNSPPRAQVASDRPSVQAATPRLLSSPSLPLPLMTAEACEYLSPSCDPASFWTYLCVCLLLVCAAGLMAGLTMGLVSLDMLNVRILEMEGSELEKQCARKVRPVLERHHLLLVTLLIVNASANEALPIFLDKLVPEGVSIVLSVTSSRPPSSRAPTQLRIAAALTPGVKVLMAVVFPVAYPISKLLDWWIGADHDAAQYKRNELKALVALQRESEAMRQSFVESRLCDYEMESSSTSSAHSSVLMSPSTLRKQPLLKPEPETEIDVDVQVETPNQRKRRRQQAMATGTKLNVDEVTIIHGALDLSSKTVAEVMLAMNQIYMLEMDTKLDRDTMADILASGHSRIPVYETRKSNIVGLLFVKKLIVLNPDDARQIRDLVLRKPILVSPSGSCYSMLNEFQKGRSHIALVTKEVELVASCWRSNQPIPPHVVFEGIVTLEDIVEELIQEPIEDESDVYVHDIVDVWSSKAQQSRLQAVAAKAFVTKKLKMLADRARERVRNRHEAQQQVAASIQITVVPSAPSVVN
ncbi:hypothetical protein PHYSODRAFT_360877 [Phytophthora sojae]|uniref:CNNM transmembrane domain-containing protein n=1 Tax=Phytophthora sojae (strain P6497) TaxID=1094619 RepID=G4ZQG6_PHYSP|nr:hypothetical protein PHYSODRAFT_360877 [Phytophthora sojae]EGZ15494.1 hypothetical protein PHYSODRAFT_360877 [Phytophthora sojae]|eukprot:XP_009529243.1 hypothetical protein PHYSODRAFT_360877 [Phytophthora sojae]